MFHDPEADRAFIAAAVPAVGDEVPVVRLNHTINDPACADRAVALLLERMR